MASLRVAFLWLPFVVFGSSSVCAADLIVTSSGDVNTASDGRCTLREALGNANSDTDLSAGDCAAGSGADAITFAPTVGAVITLGPAFNDALVISDSVTLTGPGADQLAVDAAGTGGVFAISGASAPVVTIEGITIRGGSRIQGGGIANQSTLTLRRVAVSNNQAGDDGGGIFNSGTLSVIESTISGNGGVEVGGGIANFGTLTVVNSTITGNDTRGPFAGAGIINGGAGSVSVFNSTITANVSEQTVPSFESRGGGIENRGGTFLIANSIIAGNSAPAFPENADCSGPIISSGYNLTGAGCPDGGPGDQSIAGADLPTYLGPLANNGGPTQTHALLDVAANPAVDAGNESGCRDEGGALLATDQRGSPRPSGSRCDIGAFELQQALPFHWSFLIKDLPFLNPRLAGIPVIIGFSLSGNRGLDIFATGPASRRVDCRTLAPLGPFEPTSTVAGTSLQYIALVDIYVYPWQTKTQWRHTCRELSMTLTDASTHRAVFAFR